MTDFTHRIEQLSDEKRQQLTQRLQSLQDKNTNRRLVAFVVLAENTDTSSVHEHLAEHLPDYMLPRHYIELEKLPLNANGKIDRSGLIMPTSISIGPELSELEKTLASIWSEVLDMDTIHADDDYFELGGDSITSIQIIARASIENIYFSPSDLMEHPSIRQLAKVASQNTDSSTQHNKAASETGSSNEDTDEMLRVLDLD